MGEPVIIGDCRRTVIYALVEPLNYDVPRYIGKTVAPLYKRLRAHKVEAKRRPHRPVSEWITASLSKRFGPGIRWIETVSADSSWQDRERYWIAQAREHGHSILNQTDGGEGLAGLVRSEAHRSKIAAALRRGSTVSCAKCGKPVWRKRKELKKTKRSYCSRACSNTRHKP